MPDSRVLKSAWMTEDAQAGGVARLFGAIASVWPEHRKHLERTRAALESDEVALADAAAQRVLRIAGRDLVAICADYRFLCEQMVEEQLHFAREGAYRLSTFAEAREQVYDNAPFMRRYLHGLLVGRITWLDQLRMLLLFERSFLPGNRDGYRHLEVGPGHGLLLYAAAADPRCGVVAGLDVSASSLDSTANALARLCAPRAPELIAHDLLADSLPDERRWDSIVVSEVLEHLERPEAALAKLRALLAPGGRIFITTPVNSPMPDHIYLFETPEQVSELVCASGLRIVDERCFTGAGLTEERARKRRMPISCALTARCPEELP